MRVSVRRSTPIVCVLICTLFAVPSIVEAAITTTSEIVGEDVVWSISGVSDSKIHFDSRLNLNDVTEIVYYTAPLPMGDIIAVHAEIPHARELTSGLDASRKFLISIPDADTRWVAEKVWNVDDGPPPTSVTLDHQARFSPYQAVPRYIDDRHQPDKNIQIMDIAFTHEENDIQTATYRRGLS